MNRFYGMTYKELGDWLLANNLCDEAFDTLLSESCDSRLIKSFVAMWDKTPIKFLAKLSEDSNYLVVGLVAKNENTPPYILEQISNKFKNTLYVLEKVASNPNTPINVLVELSKSNDAVIRNYVASNESTPTAYLSLLSKDEDVDVRRAVACNSSTSPDTLRELAKGPDKLLRANVAINENTPTDALFRLSKDKVYFVASAAIDHHPEIDWTMIDSIVKLDCEM